MSDDEILTPVLVTWDARRRLGALAGKKTAESGRAVSLTEVVDELLEGSCR